jgi:hypothetical protein
MENLSKEEQLIVSDSIKELLLKSAKYSRFIAIVMFDYLEFLLIVGLVCGVLFLTENIPTAVFTKNLISFAIAMIVCYYLTNKMFVFAKKVESAVKTYNQPDFEDGVKNLTTFFRFNYLLTKICLFLVLALIVFLMNAFVIADVFGEK